LIRLPDLSVRVHLEPHIPNWEIWRVRDMDLDFLAGIHAYAKTVYMFEVKPNILEIDPGPLDARVS